MASPTPVVPVVEALQWFGTKCVGVVTWVNRAERGFGIKAFDRLSADGAVAWEKWFAGIELLHQPQTGDVVTFDTDEGGIANVHRIGFTPSSVAFAARLEDKDGNNLLVRASTSGPVARVPWNGDGDAELRSGDFILCSITHDIIETAVYVATSVCTVLGRCGVCFDDKQVVRACVCDDHTFCLECIQNQIRVWYGDLDSYPLRCLQNQEDCSRLDLYGVVRPVVPAREFALVEQRDNAVTLGPGLAALCTRCGSLSYASTTRTNGAGRCHQCRGVFCRQCGVCDARHLRMSCSDYRAQEARSDDATGRFLEATSKECPQCGFRTSHFHGHGCHHIRPANGLAGRSGCPNCHTHWCYVCRHLSREANPACRFHGATFCSNHGILEHLMQAPYPHDSRCGCPICNVCRVGEPCEQCDGACVVCRGLVPPGPMQIVDDFVCPPAPPA